MAQGDREQPKILLGGKDCECRLAIARGDDDLCELTRDGSCCWAIERHVKGQDASKGRGWVGGKGTLIGLQCRAAKGDPAGIGMLDDHARRAREASHTRPCGICICKVVKREGPALQLFIAPQAARGCSGEGIKGG